VMLGMRYSADLQLQPMGIFYMLVLMKK
jgi:hypothetical protein